MNHLISNPVETSAALSLSHDWHGRLRARQCSIVRPPHLGHCLQLCVKLDTLYISKRDALFHTCYLVTGKLKTR